MLIVPSSFYKLKFWSSFSSHTCSLPWSNLYRFLFVFSSIWILSILLFSVIREQLTNTEGIRRVRKKAPCTVAEIVMLQRQALEDGLLKEPILTGNFTKQKLDRYAQVLSIVLVAITGGNIFE